MATFTTKYLFIGFFGGIATNLETTIQIYKYLYVDNDPMAYKVAQVHIKKLKRCYPHLLPIEATMVSFTTLAQDVL